MEAADRCIGRVVARRRGTQRHGRLSLVKTGTFGVEIFDDRGSANTKRDTETRARVRSIRVDFATVQSVRMHILLLEEGEKGHLFRLENVFGPDSLPLDGVGDDAAARAPPLLLPVAAAVPPKMVSKTLSTTLFVPLVRAGAAAAGLGAAFGAAAETGATVAAVSAAVSAAASAVASAGASAPR